MEKLERLKALVLKSLLGPGFVPFQFYIEIMKLFYKLSS